MCNAKHIYRTIKKTCIIISTQGRRRLFYPNQKKLNQPLVAAKLQRSWRPEQKYEINLVIVSRISTPTV